MKKQISFLLLFLSISLINALSVNIPSPAGTSNFTITYNYLNNTNQSNSTEFWITNEGDLDNVADILGSAITNDLGWITSAGADSWVSNKSFYYNKSQVFNNTAFNSTQMENSGGYLNILVSWLTSLFYTKDDINTQIINNASYFSTYNSTYASNLDTNDTKTIQDNNASWLSTYNETYLNTYNLTYANKADYEFLQNNFNGSGNITSGNIYPQATLTYDIGSGANRWNILWVRNISSENIDNSNYIKSASYCNASGTCRDLSGWGMGVDMTLYYLKTEVDNNFTLYTPVTSLYSNLTNYILSNGSRAMTGDLNLGGKNITNVKNISFGGSNSIYDNSTCIKIQGSTSLLEIC